MRYRRKDYAHAARFALRALFRGEDSPEVVCVLRFGLPGYEQPVLKL